MSPLASVLMMALLCVVLALILGPLNALPRRVRRSQELADLRARREAKYQEIRDAELDHEMGKLSQEDHTAVDTALRREALEILDAIAAMEEEGTGVPKRETEKQRAPGHR